MHGLHENQMYFKQWYHDDNMLNVLIFETRTTVLLSDLHYSSIKKNLKKFYWKTKLLFIYSRFNNSTINKIYYVNFPGLRCAF